MNIREQLKEMFQMQRTLNENILNEFGEEAMTEGKLELAIIDELGELTHELKGDWCWWKKTQPPVNRKRVLEELVDVYHFVMTWEMLDNENLKIEDLLYYYSYYISRFGNGVQGDLNDFINNVSIENDKLEYLLDLTERLGFSFDEVYQEYLNKNKINYERLKNGY
jgi:dimeric dUTPase (all-alpha-NTP-PPase superfamily)